MGKGQGNGEGWGEGEGQGQPPRGSGQWKDGLCSSCDINSTCKYRTSIP